MTDRANILLVDDREENLVALEAILEPLGHRLVSATSGTAALKQLLLDDFACILLDVQMPELDGFELAALIKQRERSQHIPIIFVTAFSSDERQVYRAYDAGAVDYIFKPIDANVLRSKVGIFVELWEKARQIHAQAELLHEQDIERLAQQSEERYRQLADAMPQIVWTSDAEGKATYFNRRWFEFTGMAVADAGPDAWLRAVHPEDLPKAVGRREETLRSGETFEIEYRFRDRDGQYRWHLGRAVPMRDANGQIELWIGTATDIHDRKLIDDQRAIIVAASDALSASLDYRTTLARVAELVAGDVADWCAVHVVEADGTVAEVAVAHADHSRETLARELQERYPPDPDEGMGPAAVIRTADPELIPEIDDGLLERAARNELHLELLRGLELRSYMCVPIKGRSRTVGAITFASSEPGRSFGGADLLFAEELARRAASAMENAQLYREAEERAQAASVLATIGDGVLLVDSTGRVRLWNPAAERITGLAAEHVVGRTVDAAIPGWSGVQLPIAASGQAARAESVPLEIGGRELWLSISAVVYEEGTVFAFRDLTEERALESMRQDLVATVSHELRTPLAAIYGAALTLRRGDIELEAELHDTLLEVIAEESGRLADIVNDLLLASQLDSGTPRTKIERCDVGEIAQLEVDAARARLPANIELRLEVPDELPLAAADAGQLRQVLANLVDNAIKYSPEGGTVTVSLRAVDHSVRVSICDSGLGIPPAEQQRIFEKFYRLDPDMSRGIGGTGLGLYICKELVRQVDGRIWVESDGISGSTFNVDIPQDPGVSPSGRRRRAATVA